MGKKRKCKVKQRFAVSGALWKRLQPLLPERKSGGPKGGRPPIDARTVANAIFFVLRTGCQWKAISRESHGCCGSLAHLRFQEWVATGVFQAFWTAGLHEYDEVKGIQWDFQSTDGAMTKAPLGGALRGRIRRIAGNPARSGRSKPTGRASPSASPSRERTATTASF